MRHFLQNRKKIISNHLQYSEKQSWIQYQSHLNLWSLEQHLHGRMEGEDMQPACTAN